ncbi:MAG: SDR family oxidoreductase [Halobacteriovoraceae bacterium]|nr:SDR family oxidoreductase [Halobacteriovoraceae bacterium]
MSLVVITGSNRGIGLELCKQYKNKGDHVVALCRKTTPELDSYGVEVVTGVDISSRDALEKLTSYFEGKKIKLLINNAGIQRNEDLDTLIYDSMIEQFSVNALGALRVCEKLLPFIENGGKIANISSRMGSVSENDLGGNYGYRMSKAALNAASRSLAIDLKEREIAVAILHPGFVKTDMTNHNGIMTTEESAKGLLKVIDDFKIGDTGNFLQFDGEKVPW